MLWKQGEKDPIDSNRMQDVEGKEGGFLPFDFVSE